MALARLPPAAHFTLNEASGNPRVDSVGSFDLAERDANLSAVSGKVGNACDFPGTSLDTLFDTVASGDLAIGDKYFAIAAWVNLDTIAAAQILASKYQNSGSLRNWFLSFGLPGAVPSWQFVVFQDPSMAVSTKAEVQPTITTSKWWFLLGWHDPVENEIGIFAQAEDGESFSKDTTTLSGGVGTTGSTLLTLGGPGESSFSLLNGQLDQVTIWHDTAGTAVNAAPTDADFEALFNDGSGQTYPYTYAPLGSKALFMLGL